MKGVLSGGQLYRDGMRSAGVGGPEGASNSLSLFVEVAGKAAADRPPVVRVAMTHGNAGNAEGAGL